MDVQAFQDFEFPLDRPVNFYLVRSGDHVLLVDTGTSQTLSELVRKGLRVDSVILTHYHMDHSGGLRALAESRDSPRVCASSETARILYDVKLVEERMAYIGSALGLGSLEVPLEAMKLFIERYRAISEAAQKLGIEEPDRCLAGVGGSYIECPGHSIDHICIVIGNNMFLGDNIVGGPNVTLLNVYRYFESMARALAIRGYTIVRPGHGPQELTVDEASSLLIETMRSKRKRLARTLAAIASKSGWVSLVDVYKSVYRKPMNPLTAWVAARSLVGYIASLEEDGLIEVDRSHSPWLVRLRG